MCIRDRYMGIKEMLGYTNDSNPFGDAALTQKFVWDKKVDQHQKGDREEQQKKQEELLKEIEEARRRRALREAEKSIIEEERERTSREREQEAYEIWLAKEKEFHLEQAKIRAEIRIKQGREQPIDNLIKVVMIYKREIAYDPSQDALMRLPTCLLYTSPSPRDS
eukprot:TRINITY_DN16879_c0_g1_i1.p1 TRINITY_DN16879_c0_g1~~TRINITY_DN16879_c0_g1_i1.p1  ORF type:complete len:165 (-),score=44.57 TRINITY_DN16879_c0_g1_i1:34-528(-)